MNKAAGSKTASLRPPSTQDEDTVGSAACASSHRTVKPITATHYGYDLGEVRTEIEARKYSGQQLDAKTKIGISDNNTFVYSDKLPAGSKKKSSDRRHIGADQLQLFADIISQLKSRFETLQTITSQDTRKSFFSDVQERSVNVSQFCQLWDKIQKSPLLHLYEHEKSFVNAFVEAESFDITYYLSDMFAVHEQYFSFLREDNIRDYWLSLFHQCEELSAEKDALISMMKQTVTEVFGIQLEPLKIPEVSDSCSTGIPEAHLTGETVYLDDDKDLSALVETAAAPRLYPEETDWMLPEGGCELSEELAHVSLDTKQTEAPSQWEQVDRTRRKERREGSVDTVAYSSKQSTRHKVKKAEKSGKVPETGHQYSKRQAVDVVMGFQSITHPADSAHVCYQGKNNFYICESRALAKNAEAASGFLTILYVYELRLQALFGWLGASQPVFTPYGRRRAYQSKGEENLEYGQVKHCKGYIETFKGHPLRSVHKANIALFSAVLKNYPESIAYQANQVCLAVRNHLRADTEAAQREGEGLCDFYQDIVEWCRHNQKKLQTSTLQTMIDTFNQSLLSLNKPGQVT